MLWLCCFSSLDGPRAEVGMALEHFVPRSDELSPVYVGGDEAAYALELAAHWNSGHDDLAVVEHDNVVRPDIVQAFHDCPEGWCAFSYDWQTNRGPALGMTRFRSAFMTKYPDAMEYAASVPSAYGKPGHWRQVGWFLTDDYFAKRGERPHVHLPSCQHLNEAQVLNAEVAHLSDEEHLRRLGYSEWAA